MAETNLKFHSGNGRRRILVVEDEAVNQQLLRMMLAETYEVEFAETGSQALEKISEPVSLILLDLNLPDMHGLALLKQIKSSEQTAGIPVIVMTADREAEVECLTAGAIDFIPKPYPPQKVVLARVLRTIELSEDRDIILSTERDTLTGLYNREYFYRYASQFDQYHRNTDTDAVVVDISHFHIINERYGKAYGDELLKSIAQKLKESLQESDAIICRREADTYLIYCPHRDDYEALLGNITASFGSDRRIRLRMGIYPCADKTLDIERRFDRAKSATDTLRSNYGKSIAWYDDSLHQKELYAEQLLEGFNTAIRENQFTVYYQPKFDVRPPEPVFAGAEALVRWKHPELGMISPGVFIPLFEDNGMIRQLDSWVWRQTAKQIREWKQTAGRSVPVSVNVSRIDMYDEDLSEHLEEIVQEYGLDHSDLILEITESAYTENSRQMIDMVSRLRQKGFRIEMDDFGTGYSSLNMLSSLPIDALKLDMQFIRSAFRERKDTRLLEVVIGLAEALSVPTIAEGVETAEQMFTLKTMGCDYVQGYYFSRPLPADEFEAYMRSRYEEEKKQEVSRRSGTRISRDRYTYDAMHDPLTGLYNHSAFDILFHDSDHDHIAVMIADIAGYDDIQRRYGKDGAVSAVVRTAEVLRDNFRSVDSICRLKEDEFVIILTRITCSMQDLVYEKVETINRVLQDPEGQGFPVSLRVGVAFFDRENPQGDIFQDADTALAALKQSDSSGCRIYGEPIRR